MSPEELVARWRGKAQGLDRKAGHLGALGLTLRSCADELERALAEVDTFAVARAGREGPTERG